MTLKAKILAVALSAGLVSPAVASSFTADDMQRVFTQDAPMHLATLSQSEMQDTKGSVAPLVAVGVMTAGRFIATRYVAPNIARSMVRSHGSNVARNNLYGPKWGVMAATRSQARSIAGRNNIREFHSGRGARYTHYHTSPRNNSHVLYGRPR